jgi:tetratricopeptide (TPR) repeat protein
VAVAKPGKPSPIKPATLVAMADLKADLAAEPNRSDSEREYFASQARDNYQKALDADPTHLGALVGMARMHELLGDHNATMSAYQTALARHPKQAAVWYHRGMYLARVRQFDAAIESFTTAANLDTKNPAYSKALGFCLARAGRPDDALPWLTKSMNEPEARYNLARMLCHIGQIDASRRQLEWVTRSQPGNEEALALLNELKAPGTAPPASGSIQPAGFTAPASDTPPEPPLISLPPVHLSKRPSK